MGVVVDDLEEAISFFERALGAAHDERVTLAEQGLELAAIQVGADGVRVELIAATRPGTTVSRFLEKRGPGLHHLAVEVEDIEAALPRYRSLGCTPLSDRPERGLGGYRTLFFHPVSTHGVLIELVDTIGRET